MTKELPNQSMQESMQHILFTIEIGIWFLQRDINKAHRERWDLLSNRVNYWQVRELADKPKGAESHQMKVTPALVQRTQC